jgi:hypothetical protein
VPEIIREIGKFNLVESRRMEAEQAAAIQAASQLNILNTVDNVSLIGCSNIAGLGSQWMGNRWTSWKT